MDKRIRLAGTFLVIVFLIAGLYFFTDWFSKVTGYFTGEAAKEKLARCLAQQGAEFYGSAFCADCEKQAQLFGEPFTIIPSVDCGSQKEHCPNVREIPAWYINERIHYGFKTLNELQDLSGCTI